MFHIYDKNDNTLKVAAFDNYLEKLIEKLKSKQYPGL